MTARADQHPSMQRLYQAAKELRHVTGQSAVGRLLKESPQTMRNWETRGISQRGAAKAQKTIGCDVTWLLEGKGSMHGRPDLGHQPLRTGELGTPGWDQPPAADGPTTPMAQQIAELFDHLFKDKVERAVAHHAAIEALLRCHNERTAPRGTAPASTPASKKQPS